MMSYILLGIIAIWTSGGTRPQLRPSVVLSLGWMMLHPLARNQLRVLSSQLFHLGPVDFQLTVGMLSMYPSFSPSLVQSTLSIP